MPVLNQQDLFSPHHNMKHIGMSLIGPPGKGKGKGKAIPITGHEGPEGEMYSSTLSLTSALDGVVNTTPWPLYPQERPATHCIGGWVGPTAGLYGSRKSRSPSGCDPRTVQPVASRYTD